MKRTSRRAATATALAVGLLVASAGGASADTVNGGYISKSGLHCGGQEVITGTSGIGPLGLKQYSWVYYNCSDSTLRRYADIKYFSDGTCYGVGPGLARVLHQMWDAPINFGHYNGTKSC